MHNFQQPDYIMKRIFNLTCLIFSGMLLFGQNEQSWPILKHYDKDHLYNIALPLGGIGTGTVSLGGRGELRDWEIMNKPGIGYSTTTKGNNAPFFSIFVKPDGESSMTRALIGSCASSRIPSLRRPSGKPAWFSTLCRSQF